MSTLVTLAEFARHVTVTDATQFATLQQYLNGAEAAARRYCHRRFDLTDYTEFYSGRGGPDLILRQGPVVSVTGIWVDGTAYFGTATGAFATSTRVTEGSDFALVRDDSYGTDGLPLGASQLVRKLGSGNAWLGWGMPSGMLATGWSQAVWPVGDGNIKVQYSAGYDPTGEDGPAVPDDLKLGIMQLASQVRLTAKMGGLVTGSEHLGEYSYSLIAVRTMVGPGDTDGLLSSARTLLEPYVRRSL